MSQARSDDERGVPVVSPGDVAILARQARDRRERPLDYAVAYYNGGVSRDYLQELLDEAQRQGLL